MSGSGKGGGIILFASWRRVGADRERQLAPDDRGSSPRSWFIPRGSGNFRGGAHGSSMAWKWWRWHVAGWWWAVGVYYPPSLRRVVPDESVGVPFGLAIQLDVGLPGVWALFVVDEDAEGVQHNLPSPLVVQVGHRFLEPFNGSLHRVRQHPVPCLPGCVQVVYLLPGAPNFVYGLVPSVGQAFQLLL